MGRTWIIAIAAGIALGTLSGVACVDMAAQDEAPAPSTEPDFKSSCSAGYTLDGTVEVECDNFSVDSATIDVNSSDWRDGKCYIDCSCSGSSEDPPADEICPSPKTLATSTFNHGCPGSWSIPDTAVEVTGITVQGACEGQDFGLDAKEQACDDYCADIAPFTATFTCCRPIGRDAGPSDGGSNPSPDGGSNPSPDGGSNPSPDGGSNPSPSDGGSNPGPSDGGSGDAGSPNPGSPDGGSPRDASGPG